MVLASVALAGAANNPTAILAGQQAITQQSLSFSRGDEQEADRIGFKNLVSAGFDPHSMSYLFEKLQSLSRLSVSNELEFLRSHPLTKKRISDAQSRAREFEGSNYRNAIEYDLVKARSVVHFAQLPRQAIRKFDQDQRRAKSDRESLIAEYGLALAHSKNNEHEDALQFMRNALNKDKDNLLLQVGILEVHIAAENYFEAEALAVSLLQLNPNNYPISMLYNRILMNKGDFSKGEEVLRNLTLKRPNDPQIWYWLAEVQGLNKKIIGLHQSRAEYFFLTGRYDSSIEHLNFALELSGNNFQLTEMIRNNLERVFLTKEQLKQASSS